MIFRTSRLTRRCSASLGRRTVRVICQRLLQPTGRFRRRPLIALRIDGRALAGQHGTVKVREVLRRLHEEGWELRRHKGSHRQLFHARYPERRFTVSGHPHLDIPKGTLSSIFKQAGWK